MMPRFLGPAERSENRSQLESGIDVVRIQSEAKLVHLDRIVRRPVPEIVLVKLGERSRVIGSSQHPELTHLVSAVLAERYAAGRLDDRARIAAGIVIGVT